MSVFVPLWFRPESMIGDTRIPSTFMLNPHPDEGAILLTREALDDPEIREGVDAVGSYIMRLFSTRAEAEAAAHMVPGSNPEIGITRDGDGILLTVESTSSDNPVIVMIEDLRRLSYHGFPPGLEPLSPSWEMTEAACNEAMTAPASTDRHDLEGAIIDILTSLPNKEILRNIQSDTEYIPGAYVSYLSLSPEDLRSDDSALFRQDAADADLQGFLLGSMFKLDLPHALEEAVSDVVRRVREGRPDLIDDESPKP